MSANSGRRSPAAGGPRLRRREFLVLGSAAALLPAIEGVARAQSRPAAVPAAESQPWRSMSVGFVEGSDLWPSFQKVTAGTLARGRRPDGGAAEPVTVLPAAQMPLGNQQLANESVRVGVHGLYPIPNPSRVRRVDLTVLFPAPDDSPSREPLPFYAWSYKSKPAPNPSPPLKFVAPLGVDGSFQLRLDVVPGDERQLMTRRATLGMPPETPGGRFAADFTVDWFEGRPKLQRGIYLLGLAGNTWGASRSLPIHQPRQPRPLELLSLIVSIDAAPPEE